DNNPEGGAVDWEQISINVESTMGPLQVTAPNGGETFDAGGIMTVTWNPRNSESMCTNAAIRLSTDGGATFPVTLASEVDYSTGTADVVLPASLTNTDEARIMVACDDYICFQWYDMSNTDFSLESNCFSPVTRLCDTEPGEYEFGEDALNFGLETITGVPALSVEGQVENTPPTMPPAVNDFNGNCTRIASISNAFDTLRFMVTESGSYRFDFETNGANFIKAYTIFDAATFDSGNACPSFIESNASFIGNFGFLPVITTELEACKEYLMASQITNADTRDIAITGITGPGDFVPIEYAQDYSTTFIAIDPVTDEIKFFDNNSDFRMLDAGEYNIYAASYKSGGPTPPADVDLNSWIGMTTEDLLSSGDCYRIGVNYKSITIISTCTVFDMTPTDQTMCDPISNTYSQTLTFKIDKGPGTGTVEINGQVFNVQPDSMEVTLTGLIADGNPVDLAIAFSDDISCNRILDDVFTAPENCCPVSVDLGDQVLVECEGNSIILDGGPDGAVYQWFRDGIELMDSERELTVTESGIYRVIVSDANGCAKPDEVEVQFNPLADILPAQDIEGCEGDVFTVAPVTTADSLAWYNNGVYLASGPELDITESGEYIIYAINEFGCERADTFQANFLEAPVVDFGDDQVLCEGDVLILDAGDPDNFYGWVKDGVQLSESSNMLEVTEDGTYIVVVVNANLCESIDQITVSFRELPEPDLGEDQMRCQGETYEIIANANGFDIEWYKDDVLIQGESGDTLIVSETGNYRTKVSAGDDCSIEDEIQVTFNESPIVDLGEDQLLCEGTIFQLDAGDNTNTHIWTQDGVDLMNNTNIQEATTNGNYIVVATNANDCSTSDSISLEFNPLPDIDLGPDQSLCADMIYTIQANTNGFDIEWYTNGVLQSGATEFELIANESGEYIARVYSGVDCFREDTVQITYNPLPDFDLGEDRSACEGETITIDAGTGGYDYEWYINGTLIQQGAMSTLDILEDAEIIVTAYTEFECTSSDTVNATFIQMPEISLEDDFEFCEGESITITASSNVSTLTWFHDGNELTG
ncbi:MAG: hypothetical protein HKN67_04390, partial [Saprospiraceae bacterium]|nr:hypothetical protein [Saprospiraceae bacterium]